MSLQNRAHIARVIFDPKNPAHIASFKVFVKTGNWGDIQFHAELPYNEVPMTVMMKFAEFRLNVRRETESDRQARFMTEKPDLVFADLREEGREEKLARYNHAHRMVVEASRAMVQ